MFGLRRVDFRSRDLTIDALVDPEVRLGIEPLGGCETPPRSSATTLPASRPHYS